MQIEMMPTDRLVPYIRNARTHSADQVAQIAASIAEFGFTNPILIGEDDVIIAGHGRLQAARSLGLTEVPVIVLDHLTEAQRRALVIADNRIAEHAGWDAQMLASEIAALRDEAFDLEVIGFSEDGAPRPARRARRSRRRWHRLRRRQPAGGGDPAAAPAPTAAPATTLAERFGIPPFSVLDARKGWWQDRKRAWLDLGIRSELGRGEGDRRLPGRQPDARQRLAQGLPARRGKAGGVAWLRGSPGPSGRT